MSNEFMRVLGLHLYVCADEVTFVGEPFPSELFQKVHGVETSASMASFDASTASGNNAGSGCLVRKGQTAPSDALLFIASHSGRSGA